MTMMKIDDLCVEVELLIIDDALMHYDLVIGRDILSENCVIIEKGQCRVMALKGEKVNINESLNENEKCRLQELMERYSVCFAENLKEIGKCGVIEMDIKINSDKPIARKPYNIPIPKRRTVDNIINELL